MTTDNDDEDDGDEYMEDEEGMQATSSMGCDNSQGDGRTNLVGEDDNINDVASKVIMYDNIDLEASNCCA